MPRSTPAWTAYNHARYDWFHAPHIGCLARHDGRILVEASDEVLFTRVKVTLLDEGGCVLEEGEAVRQEGDWWAFACRAEAAGKTVIAQAWDLPGHVTELALDSM